jgi:hypothetical protein
MHRHGRCLSRRRASHQGAIAGALLLSCLPSLSVDAYATANAGTAAWAPKPADHTRLATDVVPQPPPDASAKASAPTTGDTAASPDALPDAQSKPSDEKEKDVWDKAEIISGFLATVVLAAVGLLINSSIQRAQINSAKESTAAQIAVAERNNKAQLDLTERNAAVQSQIQQSALAGELVEHLTGGSPLKKQIAIVALRRSVPPAMYQEIITIVVRSETDPEVRKTALGQAATMSDAEPSVVQAVAQAATDTNRATDEREIATNAVQELGLRSVTPSGTFVFASSHHREVSIESAALEGGVFTHFLVKGLAGEADADQDGSISTTELARYLYSSVSQFTNDGQRPFHAAEAAAGSAVIVGPASEFTKTIVVAIGNSDYRDPKVSPLAYGHTDALRVAEVFRSKGAIVHVLQNAPRRELLQAVRSAFTETDDRSLLVFYYTGHADVDHDGVFYLLPVDTDMDMLASTAVSTNELRSFLDRASAGTKVMFLDTAFAGAAATSLK